MVSVRRVDCACGDRRIRRQRKSCESLNRIISKVDDFQLSKGRRFYAYQEVGKEGMVLL